MTTAAGADRSHANEILASTSAFRSFLSTTAGQPIFVILGVQGSGTNLLRSILTQAFNFSVVQDQSLIFNAAVRLGDRPAVAEVQREFDAARNRMLPSTLTRKTHRKIKSNGSFEGIERHFDASAITSGSDFARFMYSYTAFSRDSDLMAIKSDDLWESIAHIDSVLPNRRVILLTRDFRDNLLSITKKGFGPVEPLMAARYVKDRFAYYDAEYRRSRPDQRFHVRYEELLEAPEAFVTRFRDHFDLGVRGPAVQGLDTGRIRRNNTRKWGGLSPRQLGYCEALLHEELDAYGYASDGVARVMPGVATWLAARAKDTVRRIPQKLRRTLTRLRA